MKYMIENNGIIVETNRFCETIADLRNEDISFMYEIIYDAFCDYEIVPKGYFYEYDEGETVLNAARKSVFSRRNQWVATSKAIDDAEGEVKEQLIDFTELLIEMIAEEAYFGEFSACVGGMLNPV